MLSYQFAGCEGMSEPVVLLSLLGSLGARVVSEKGPSAKIAISTASHKL
jgi:hypothetical protein